MSTVTLQRVKTLQIVDTAAFVGKPQKSQSQSQSQAQSLAQSPAQSQGQCQVLQPRKRPSSYKYKTGLFKLPVEVRQRIWTHAFSAWPKKDCYRISSICFIHSDLTVAPPDEITKHLVRHAKSDLPAIFSVDHALYHELLQSLLQMTTFYILSPASATLFANWVGLANQLKWVRSLRIRRIIDMSEKEEMFHLIERCTGLERLEMSFECEDLEDLGNGPFCGLDAFPGDPIGRLADVISTGCKIKQLTLSCPCEKADIKMKKHKNTEKGLALLETWFKSRFESTGNGNIEIIQQHKRR